MTLETVGILGCGLMGSGIAQVSAQAGYPTRVYDVDPVAREQMLAAVQAAWSRAIDRGRATEQQVQQWRSNLETVTSLEGLADRDLVIEAITENREVKLTTYREMDTLCKAETILASNTSSLSITEMAVVTQRPERVVGLHFFNPVPVMQLVEIVRTLLTDESVIEQMRGLAERLGKTAVLAKDRTGFIVNRLLVPYLLEAIKLLDQGMASREDIDAAMRLGCGYPMGPLQLLDFVGLDTTYYIANIMYEEFREPQFAPPPLLKRMVLAGRLGRKSGSGFYDYENQRGSKRES